MKLGMAGNTGVISALFGQGQSGCGHRWRGAKNYQWPTVPEGRCCVVVGNSLPVAAVDDHAVNMSPKGTQKIGNEAGEEEEGFREKLKERSKDRAKEIKNQRNKRTHRAWDQLPRTQRDQHDGDRGKQSMHQALVVDREGVARKHFEEGEGKKDKARNRAKQDAVGLGQEDHGQLRQTIRLEQPLRHYQGHSRGKRHEPQLPHLVARDRLRPAARATQGTGWRGCFVNQVLCAPLSRELNASG